MKYIKLSLLQRFLTFLYMRYVWVPIQQELVREVPEILAQRAKNILKDGDYSGGINRTDH